MALSPRILLPFFLSSENAPSISVSSLFLNSTGDDLIVGTHDGFIISWKIIADQKTIVPRLMLIGHTSQVSFIVATNSHQLEHFVSISDNDGEIKLWNNEDGRCIEHIRTNLKHRTVQSFNYPLTQDNFLICCGCYSEILIYNMRTLELKYTLTPSHVDADWISTFFVFQKSNAPDVIITIGLLDSGCVKLWAFDPRTATTTTSIEATSFSNNNSIVSVDLKEHESKEIRTEFGSIIVPCDECQRMMLIVHGRGWQIFDGIDFTEVCSYTNDEKEMGQIEHWIGGHFPTTDLVILFSARGFGHIFRLSENAAFASSKFRTLPPKNDTQKSKWLSRLTVGNELKLSQTPIFHCQTKSKICQIYRADASGQISVWQLNLKNFNPSEEIFPNWSVSYVETWRKSIADGPTIRKVFEKVRFPLGESIAGEKIDRLTAFCHLLTMDRISFGDDKGRVFIVPALKFICAVFLDFNENEKEKFGDVLCLNGHSQAVTCIVHPHSEYPRYDVRHMLTGSLDQSIRLWDLTTQTESYVFNLHSGSILSLLIPPPMLNTKMQFSVCSVASDHSVSLISLREPRVILLANRQTCPIVGIRWRINDDFLLIKCLDGSLFVWQIETGHLDRVAHGVIADDLFDWYNDPRLVNPTGDALNDALVPAVNAAHFTQIRSTGKRRDPDFIRKLNKKYSMTRHDLMASSTFKPTEYRIPLVVHQFHTNIGEDLSLLVIFDLLHLVSQIIVFDLEKQHAQKLKHLDSSAKENNPLLSQVSSSLSTLSNLLVSLLHPWSFDKSIDRICAERLRLKRPNSFSIYGILSRNEHLALLLPTWQKYLHENVPETFTENPQALISFVGMDSVVDDPMKQKQERLFSFVHQWRWKFSSSLNTEHLLSLVTMVYILMNCDRWINNSADDQALFEQRDAWSKLLHFYCSEMIEHLQTNVFQSLSIEILACHWQDLCLELRDAARKLLEKELDHLHSQTDAWQIFISKWSNLFNLLYSKENDGALQDPDIRDVFLDDLTYYNETTVSTVTQQFKAQQLLSIILMGIVGTRYGQEIETNKQGNVPIKGFTVENPEMILKLSGLLTRLLSMNNVEHIPLHSTLRRTAIDLIGRGYTIWEPYIDIGQVLLTLLDLSATSDSTTHSSKHPNIYTSSVLSGILTSKTDTCLTARTALTLIATSRSNVVIITLARELAKHALAQSGTGPMSTVRAPPMTGSMVPPQAILTIKNTQKNEILRLIKILIEKCPHDVAELIVEVTDIILHCIDLNLLRHKGVQAVSDTFASLLRYPMVTFCSEPAKLCVGTKAGVLALYDLKSTKYQSIQAHPKSETITCVEFSPDGKYLASYAAFEGILYFWESSANFFSSSNSMRLVTRHAAQRLERSTPSPMRKVDMNWIDRNTVRMFWHVDRSEKRYTI